PSSPRPRPGPAWGPASPRSGGQPRDRPAPRAVGRVLEAVVEPTRATLPELEPVRDDAEAAPERGARRVGAGEAGLHLGEPGVEGGAVGERAALGGGPGAEAAARRAAGEVGVGLGVGHALDAAFDAHLPLDLGPPEDEGGAGVGLQLPGLPA